MTFISAFPPPKANSIKAPPVVRRTFITSSTTLAPDSAAFKAVAQAPRNIDWRALLGPCPIPAAPLLNAAPVSAAQNTISPELIDELCKHLKAVYYPLQKLKGV